MATFLVRLRREGDEREMDSKACPFPNPTAFNADVAAMLLVKLLDDCQSEPQSAMPTSCRRVPLLKTVEDIRQELGRDAFTRIDNADFYVRVDAFEQHLDLPAPGSELDGVVKKIPKNLLQAIRVARNRPGTGVHKRVQANALRLRRGAYRID